MIGENVQRTGYTQLDKSYMITCQPCLKAYVAEEMDLSVVVREAKLKQKLIGNYKEANLSSTQGHTFCQNHSKIESVKFQKIRVWIQYGWMDVFFYEYMYLKPGILMYTKSLAVLIFWWG